jgi:Kef-type K+ transport system membrane component KefB
MLISDAIVIASIIIGMIVPVVLTWRHANYWKIIVYTWFSLFLASIFIDFAVPIIASSIGEQKDYHPPNVPVCLAVAFTGWIYGLIMAGVVWLIRKLHDKRGNWGPKTDVKR